MADHELRFGARSVRAFRFTQTRSEAMLWQALKAKQIDDVKFRRQHSLGRFVVDFYCASRRLVIEIDGAVHEQRVAADNERDEHLRAAGHRILRFTSNEVEHSIGDVIDRIRAEIGVIDSLQAEGKDRMSQTQGSRWLKFEMPPSALPTFRISATEQAADVHAFAHNALRPLAIEQRAFVLDFGDVEVATQSFIHALLFDVLRMAWATRTPIYVQNTKPAVRSSLLLVENYALAG